MLPSSQRLTTPLFDEVMEKGKFFYSPLFTMKAMKIEGISRFSVVVSKKVGKTAVERNRGRRRMYSVLRVLYPRVATGFHGVFIMKAAAKVLFADLSHATEEFFVKIGILK